jgi:hypothetical protein
MSLKSILLLPYHRSRIDITKTVVMRNVICFPDVLVRLSQSTKGCNSTQLC